MSFPKILLTVSGFLFCIIVVAAYLKSDKGAESLQIEETEKAPLEVELDREIRLVEAPIPAQMAPTSSTANDVETEKTVVRSHTAAVPDADRMAEFFNKNDPRLPIVQTITYKSRVDWQKGRPAWLSDYASHYSTSRHFIARSLNGKPDYFKQNISEGDRFNVLHPDKHISFHLLIDASRSKMWFYYLDKDTNERVLLKTYAVGLGRIDSSKASGMLTPLGKYRLGEKIAIYKPKTMGLHNGQKMEMIRIFGSRWIPFGSEVSGATAPAEGFGIHGVPWIPNEKGELVENIGSLGKYESDGCIRLSTQDMEELFAVIITRPTTVELVKDFFEAKLPGVERNTGPF